MESLPSLSSGRDWTGDVDKIIFEEYYPKIYKYVFYRVLNKENAEDITSEVFYKAMSSKDTFDDRRASYSTWIFTIAHNCVVNFFRNQKITESLDGFEIAAAADNVLDIYIKNEDTKRACELLGSLPERDRTIIALRFWGEFSYKEIAERMGLSQTNVSTILNRAIERLRLMW
jgi:RNA polymerase sigma-70 factor (ECF subfamily)